MICFSNSFFRGNISPCRTVKISDQVAPFLQSDRDICCPHVNPFQNDTFWTLPDRKSLQTTIFNWMKTVEISPEGWKSLWEKEKLLVTSNFSFSHGVFKRLVLQTCKNQGLFGKRLILKIALGILNCCEKEMTNSSYG